jgi:hypothetical protein
VGFSATDDAARGSVVSGFGKVGIPVSRSRSTVKPFIQKSNGFATVGYIR